MLRRWSSSNECVREIADGVVASLCVCEEDEDVRRLCVVARRARCRGPGRG